LSWGRGIPAPPHIPGDRGPPAGVRRDIDRHLPLTLDVLNHSGSVAGAWRDAWTDRRFRVEAVVSPVALVAVLAVMARFLSWVERRPGVVLADPVLALLPPRDLT